MTSGKSYINWLKEAGRGHLVAALSWGSYGILMGVLIVRIQIDPLYTFFGLGNNLLLYLQCTGMGVALGLMEFFYLLQDRKLDFYFSLPVKRNTIFYGRYLHGILHGLLPLVCYMMICGICQSSLDEIFMKYSADYTFRSILVYSMIFLLFYQITVFAVCSCGRMAAVLCMTGFILCGFQIFLENVCLVFMKQFYKTFYKSPLLELLEKLLVPWKWGQNISAQQTADKFLLSEYRPDAILLLSGVVWNLIFAVLIYQLQKSRKAERTGKIFTGVVVERAAEILGFILAGTGICGFLLGAADVPRRFGILAVLILTAAGVLGAVGLHVLLEGIQGKPFRMWGRRKGQILLECLATAGIVLLLSGSAEAYDSYLPEDRELQTLGIGLGGVDMEMDIYADLRYDSTGFRTEELLQRYTLSEKGKEAGMRWIRMVQENEKVHTAREAEDAKVTVCFQKDSGNKVYRTYPVSEEMLTAFADVYETMEYKSIAYPLMMQKAEMAEGDRVIWNDGVCEKVLSLTEDEKKDFLKLYSADIKNIKMAELQTAFPVGRMEFQSELYDRDLLAVIYPFYKHCCQFLREHEVDPERQLSDYPVLSVTIREEHGALPGRVGGSTMRRYETEKELEEWKGRLIPQEFCIQPLLNPVDVSVNAEAEIREPESGAVTLVECYVRRKKE